MESKRPAKEHKERKEYKEKKDDFKSHRLFQLPTSPIPMVQLFPSDKMSLRSRYHPIAQVTRASSDNITPIELALAFKHVGKDQDAIELFLWVINDCDQTDSNRCLACYNLSSCYFQRGDALKAREFIDKAIAILEMPEVEKEHGVCQLRSYCFLEKGKIHRKLAKEYLVNDIRYNAELAVAKHYMQKAIHVWPGHTFAYNSLGLLLSMQGNSEAAKALYQSALSLDPEYPTAHANLGDLLKNEGSYEKAIEHFNKAILNEPKNASHYENRGLTYQALGQLDQATEDFETAIGLDSGECSYKTSLAMNYILRGDSAHAISYLVGLLKAYPANTKININLGFAYVMTNRYEEAIAVCLEVLKVEPSELTCLKNLSTSYYMLEDYEKALITLDKIIADPRIENSGLRYSAYVQIAQIMTRFKYFDEAINTYEAAYQLCPSESLKARLDFELGNLYFDNRHYPKALLHYQKANIACPSDVIRNYIAETEEMIKNPHAIPTSRLHVDMPEATVPSEEFKSELEESLELKLCRVRNRSISYSKDLVTYPLLKPDEVKQKNPKLYELSKGEDDIWYKRGIYRMSSGELKVAAGSNKFNFVVKVDGDNPPKIVIGHVGHFYLSKQEDVLFAGEIVIKDGKIGLWNNGSGHFMPRDRSAEVVAKVTGLPLEKFFSLENISKLLQGLYEKYQNVEKMAKTYDMRDLAFGDKRLVKSMRRYFI